MATREPQRFEVILDRNPSGGSPATLPVRPAGQGTLRAGDRPAIVGGAPPEFGGTPGVWSPEHLFLSAVALCFLTTFEWFAGRAPVAIADFHCRAVGTVAKTSKGLAFTSVRLEARAVVPPGAGAAARELLDKAKHACLVSNSLQCPVELAAEVVETTAAEVPATV